MRGALALKGGLDEDRDFGLDGGVEDAAVAGDEVGGAGGFAGVVAEFDRGDAVGAGEFADERDGFEGVFVAGMAAAEVVGEERAPAGGETDAAVEVGVELGDGGGVEGVGGDEALGVRVFAAGFEPGDVLVAGEEGVFGVDALAGPFGRPLGAWARNWEVPKVSGSMMRSSLL